MKQYTDSDKLFRSDMLRRYPGKHTKIYRDYAYDPDVEGAFHTAEEIDEYLKDYIEEDIASCMTEE